MEVAILTTNAQLQVVHIVIVCYMYMYMYMYMYNENQSWSNPKGNQPSAAISATFVPNNYYKQAKGTQYHLLACNTTA